MAATAPPSTRRRGTRNPADPETQAYTDFRGRGPVETLKFREAQLQEPADMWAIGDLTGLWLCPVEGDDYTKDKWGKPTIGWKESDGMKLAADAHEGNRQLYIVGGSSEARTLPEAFLKECQPESYDRDSDYQFLGPVYGIAYTAEKRMDKFIPTSYGHQFGEENGTVPLLWYHRPGKSFILTGGDYRIEEKDRSLGNSPGIAN